MWAALRSRSRFLPLSPSPSSPLLEPWKLGFLGFNHTFSSSVVDVNNNSDSNKGLLDLQEVEKVLSDVKADNVKVIPVGPHCTLTDFMVIATGRSSWHVKNIAQALIYKKQDDKLYRYEQAKQKQKGARRLLLPSVEGQEGGKWVVIDSGTVIVHALDEKARDYYNLENLWTTERSPKEPSQDLEKAFVKLRRKNNSKKRAQRSG